MNRARIEAWAHAIIDRVQQKQNVEDAHVELKADWIPDHRDAARRIAAQCNAARGDPVLFLFGVDEKLGIVGITNIKMANWWSQV